MDHMYAKPKGPAPDLAATHHTIFRGERDAAGYNNHVYLAHFGGRFWAIWSCSAVDGGHAGQHIRYATSADGMAWSKAGVVTRPPAEKYCIARGLWVRDGVLLALAARCAGQGPATRVEALSAYRWDAKEETWASAGSLGADIINNYAPIRLASGAWMVPYRDGELNRVDGVMIGGVESLDTWERVPFPGDEQDHLTEANAVIRADRSVAVHFRDNDRSGFLYRSVSKDGGTSFSEPRQTDFPDCKCKHYCLFTSTGTYVLVNNPETRRTLCVSGSPDGVVFGKTAVLRREPPEVRNPGHDKSPSFTYPHAIEHGGDLWVAYSSSRDDIVLSRLSLEEIEKTLGAGGYAPRLVAIGIDGGYGRFNNLELKADGTGAWFGREPGRQMASHMPLELDDAQARAIWSLARKAKPRQLAPRYRGGDRTCTLEFRYADYTVEVRIEHGKDDDRPEALTALLDALTATRNRLNR